MTSLENKVKRNLKIKNFFYIFLNFWNLREFLDSSMETVMARTPKHTVNPRKNQYKIPYHFKRVKYLRTSDLALKYLRIGYPIGLKYLRNPGYEDFSMNGTGYPVYKNI